MKKIIKHKWKLFPYGNNKYQVIHQCEHCGCKKYWDFDYNCIMYKYGTKVAYRAPSCIIPLTGVPYNK